MRSRAGPPKTDARRSHPPEEPDVQSPTIPARPRAHRLLAAAVTTLALVAGALAGATPAQAAGPYERGPAPTSAALDASRGPFATAQQSVSSLSVSGFGGGV